MPKVIDISDYCKVINSQAKRTYVFFSSIRTPQSQFSFYRIGTSLSETSNVVFLNTHKPTWYYEGIPGLGSDVKSTILSLQNILNQLNTTEELIFVGGSMGAYAAILFSTQIKEVSEVLAFGPEILLGLDGGYSKNHIGKISKDKHYDLLFLMSKTKTHFNIYIGDSSHSDIYNVSKLYEKSYKNVSIFSLKNLDHDLPKYLVDKYNLVERLSLNNFSKNLFFQETLSFFYKNSYIAEQYYLSGVKKKQHNQEELIITLKKLLDSSNEKYERSIISLCLGRLLSATDKPLSVGYLKKAYILSSHNFNIFFEYLNSINFKYMDDEKLFLDFFEKLDPMLLKFAKYRSYLNNMINIFLQRKGKYLIQAEYIIKKYNLDYFYNDISFSKKQQFNSEVLIGTENILFLNSGKHSVSNLFTGKKGIAEISKRNFFLNIKRRQNYCDKNNIIYLNVIFPEKLFLYKKYHTINNCRSLYLDKYATSRHFRDDINNLYLGNSLVGVNDVFFKTDTHFSLNGNIEATKSILNIVNKEYIDFQSYTDYIKDGTNVKNEFIGDLGRKFDPPISEKTKIFTLDKQKVVIANNGLKNGNDGIIVLCENESAVSDQTLLIFGDSFFRSLLPHLSFFYKRIFFCRTRFFHHEIVKLIKPETIFTGMAERYMSKIDLDEEKFDFFAYPYIKNKPINPSKEFSHLFVKFISRKR